MRATCSRQVSDLFTGVEQVATVRQRFIVSNLHQRHGRLVHVFTHPQAPTFARRILIENWGTVPPRHTPQNKGCDSLKYQVEIRDITISAVRHEVPEVLRLAWEATARAEDDSPPEPSRWTRATIPEQFAIMVSCRDEAQQVELPRRFHGDGLECRALVS